MVLFSRLTFINILLFSHLLNASNKGITFQGMLKDPSSTLVNASGLTIRARVLAPNGCVLRDESFTGQNITNGYLSLTIGSGSLGGMDPALAFKNVFNNSTGSISSLTCIHSDGSPNGGLNSYTPGVNDTRKLHISMTIGTEDINAQFNMRAMPFAINSDNLNGKADTDFVNINSASGVSQSNIESIFSRFNKLDSILSLFNSGGSIYSGNAATATSATNVTGTVGVSNGGTGATTASLARTNLGLGSLATISPTGLANSSTFLRGDGVWVTPAGSGTITEVIAGSGLSGGGTSGSVTVGLMSCASGQILTYTGSAWTCTAPSTGTVTSVGGSSPISSTGGDNPTLSISQANSSTNGYLSSADWVTFNSKQGSSTELNAVAGIPTTGILQRTGAGTYTTLGATSPIAVVAGNIVLDTVPVGSGGTGATTASGARISLGAASSGANTDITSLSSTASVSSTAALSLNAGGTDQNVNLVPTGSGTVDVGTRRITSVATPTVGSDAATKAYVDAAGASTSCPVVGGSTYYTVGGGPNFCQRATLNSSGGYTYLNVNEGFPCAAGKICSSGSCVDPASVASCSGSPSVGNSCTGGSIYAGTFNGYRYMTTPPCSDATCSSISGGTLIAGSSDSTTRGWMNTNSATYATDTNYGLSQTEGLAATYAGALAAKFCADLTFAGYSDWYLPAENELLLLYTNRGSIGGFVASGYWSSTESGNDYTWMRDFSNGVRDTRIKSIAYYIRCVRRY